MSSKRSGESNLRFVKLIGRIVGVVVSGVALFFRALARGKRAEPTTRRAPAVATSPPPTPSSPRSAVTTTTAPAPDNVPAGIHMPHPTIWPLVLSLGITLAALGIVTNLVFSALGILCMIWAIAGWVGDLRHG